MSVRLSSSEATPLEVLTESVKQLPVMRYALGVAGVGAVATVVLSWLKNPTAGFFSMVVVVVLMIVLIVVSWMLKLAASRTKLVAEAFLWFAMIVCVFVPLSLSVSSFF